MGIKDIKKENTFKSITLERTTKKADDRESFINNAEGETSLHKSTHYKAKGAPLKDELDKRSKRLHFYCTKDELDKIKEMAKAYNMKISEFIRFKILFQQMN